MTGGMVDITASHSYSKADASASKAGDIRTGDKVFNVGGFSGSLSPVVIVVIVFCLVGAGYFIYRKKGGRRG